MAPVWLLYPVPHKLPSSPEATRPERLQSKILSKHHLSTARSLWRRSFRSTTSPQQGPSGRGGCSSYCASSLHMRTHRAKHASSILQLPLPNSVPQPCHKPTASITSLQQGCSTKFSASSLISSKVAQQSSLLQNHARTARVTALCQPVPCKLLLHFSALIFQLG